MLTYAAQLCKKGGIECISARITELSSLWTGAHARLTSITYTADTITRVYWCFSSGDEGGDIHHGTEGTAVWSRVDLGTCPEVLWCSGRFALCLWVLCSPRTLNAASFPSFRLPDGFLFPPGSGRVPLELQHRSFYSPSGLRADCNCVISQQSEHQMFFFSSSFLRSHS